MCVHMRLLAGVRAGADAALWWPARQVLRRAARTGTGGGLRPSTHSDLKASASGAGEHGRGNRRHHHLHVLCSGRSGGHCGWPWRLRTSVGAPQSARGALHRARPYLHCEACGAGDGGAEAVPGGGSVDAVATTAAWGGRGNVLDDEGGGGGGCRGREQGRQELGFEDQQGRHSAAGTGAPRARVALLPTPALRARAGVAHRQWFQGR